MTSDRKTAFITIFTFHLTWFLSSSAGWAAPFWTFFRSFSLMVLKIQASLPVSFPPDAWSSGSLQWHGILGISSMCRAARFSRQDVNLPCLASPWTAWWWRRQLTHQIHQSCLRPETAPISTSCICQSALSGKMSFWRALQCTCVLTALWQLASKGNTQHKHLH